MTAGTCATMLRTDKLGRIGFSQGTILPALAAGQRIN
jgi:hypothetical protein